MLVEQLYISIPVELTIPDDSLDLPNQLVLSIISGKLPTGMVLEQPTNFIIRDNLGSMPQRVYTGYIKGNPASVRSYTTYKFVLRAIAGDLISDQTYTLSVDGYDIPVWLTESDFLDVGAPNSYFVLDSSEVNYQLKATDAGLVSGDTLSYYLVENAGHLPPGLSLSSEGLISGFIDPVYSISNGTSVSGGFDMSPWDSLPYDYNALTSTGYDTYYYDTESYDYSEPAAPIRSVSKIYPFVVAVTDGTNVVNRLFKIFVVTEEFLKTSNILMSADTTLFRADSTGDREPIWITDSYLGKIRADNYVTLEINVYNPPALNYTLGFFLLDKNPDSSNSTIPPGTSLDSATGYVAGKVPYQNRVTINYKFTIQVVNFSSEFLKSASYNMMGNWSASTTYYINDAVVYNDLIYICVKTNYYIAPTDIFYWVQGTASSSRTFTVDVLGEIDSAISWISPSNCGTIKPNQPCNIQVVAENLLSTNGVSYKWLNGKLPSGLTFVTNGIIEGKVKPFADTNGPGLLRFYDTIDSPGVATSFDNDTTMFDHNTTVFNKINKSFTITYDNATTTFDRKFTFTVLAQDNAMVAQVPRTFYFTVLSEVLTSYANLYVKSFQSKQNRIDWVTFITDNSIFKYDELYKPGDVYFGVQVEQKVLLFAGIESKSASAYIQCMSKNHNKKQLLMGDVKYAKARDLNTQEVVYEVVYVDVIDPLEVNGTSISNVVKLPSTTNAKILISYNDISIDSDIPLVSDSDVRKVFPNSIINMRNNIASVGIQDHDYLPLWMKTIQDGDRHQLEYTKALVLCYVRPGLGNAVVSRIHDKLQLATRGNWNKNIPYQVNDTVYYNSFYYTCVNTVGSSTSFPPDKYPQYWIRNFDFKLINFTIDRYIIDMLDNTINDSYLAFPTDSRYQI
jgi:hypothetical protein